MSCLLYTSTLLISLCLKIMSILITVILYGRMIEIYCTVSIAPIPIATMSNREWGSIGTNYLKGLFALAFQGFQMCIRDRIEGEDVKTFLKEVLLPLLIALCLAAFFKPVYMADGVCDYFLLWLCVGFPFGIRRMCLWLVPFGYGISGTVGIFALNIIIGGLIGGLALIVGLLLGIIHTIREII